MNKKGCDAEKYLGFTFLWVSPFTGFQFWRGSAPEENAIQLMDHYEGTDGAKEQPFVTTVVDLQVIPNPGRVEIYVNEKKANHPGLLYVQFYVQLKPTPF